MKCERIQNLMIINTTNVTDNEIFKKNICERHKEKCEEVKLTPKHPNYLLQIIMLTLMSNNV